MKNIARAKAGLAGLKAGRLLLGITGAPAGGKSAVLAMLGRRGFFCVSADAVAREVLTDSKCYNKILKKFGPEIVLKNGTPDRRGLSLEIFGDSSKRKWLEELLHPEILKRIRSLIIRSHSNTIAVEAPLLFEAGLKDCFTATVCVTAPAAARVSRAACRGWSRGELQAREAAQFTQARKAGLADFVIHNGGRLDRLETAVDGFCAKLEKLRGYVSDKANRQQQRGARRKSENGK